MEVKSTAAEFKLDANAGVFEGYAAHFSNADSYGDIIQPGAFRKTLQERQHKLRVLWNHDAWGLPIAKHQTANEDGQGLYVKAAFVDTTLAQDVRKLLQEGAVDSMSIGFTTVKSEDDEHGQRLLTELRLFEYSPVTFPANELAVITAVKSGNAEQFITQLEDFIQVGLKRGRPLSAPNLTRLKSAVTDLHALLSADPEPPAGTQDAQGAATADAEPHEHSDDLLPALKSFTPFPQTRDEAAVLAELKSAFAFIHQGA